MLNHWKSPNSPHKILLSSRKTFFLTKTHLLGAVSRDFLFQKPNLIPEVLQIQIYQNEVHINDLSPSSFRFGSNLPFSFINKWSQKKYPSWWIFSKDLQWIGQENQALQSQEFREAFPQFYQVIRRIGLFFTIFL